MRLIDATDLKKAVIEFFDGVHLCDVNGADIIQDVNSIIDKAPTKEFFCPYLSDDEIKQPCLQGPCFGGQVVPDALQGWRYEERPRGKWIYKQESDYEFWECSNCGEPWDLIEGTPKDNNMNFCPNCGAQITEEATDDEI